MVVFIQYTLTDLRRFQDHAIFLKSPTWPIPDSEAEFVRGSGKIVERKKSKQKTFSSEKYLNTLKKGIKLPKHIYIKELGISLKQVSKHFTLGDRAILSKFEFVYVVRKRYYMVDIDYKSLIGIAKELLETPLHIRNMQFKYSTTAYKKSLAHLKEFHLLATTKLKELETEQSKLLVPCIPQIYFTLDRETLKTSNTTPKADLNPDGSEIDIFSGTETIHEKKYRIWISQRRENRIANYEMHSQPKAEERATRINILRLHAEACNLNNIFRGIIKGTIDVGFKSAESDDLQNYIVSMIALLTKNYDSPNSESINYARTVFNAFLPDELEELKERIETFNFRPQLTKNIKQFINIHMEEHNTINAPGDGNINFIGNRNEVTNEANVYKFPENYDYDKLAEQLEQLKLALKSKIDDDFPEHYEETSKVVNAEKMAREKNGNKILEYLKKTGSWVLNIAKEIGVPLVTEILKKQAGLP